MRRDDQSDGLDRLLDIDVDAELRKLCERSFRSPQHYPVELVRSALARGAQRVRVEIRRDRVVVDDDGAGLRREQRESLTVLLDRRASASARQAALPELERLAGLGLLAALAPSPRLVVIESAGGGGVRGELRTGRGVAWTSAARGSGTRITIFRRGVARSREREILRELCRFARAEIWLGVELISQQQRFRASLAEAELPARPPIMHGWVAIPERGDLCRAWQLVHGVRQRQWALEPIRGLVFELVVDCPGELPDELLREAHAVARGLYQELAQAYDTLAPTTRDRVEELLFLAYRSGHARALVRDLDLFQVVGEPRRRRLAELESTARAGPLRALRAGDPSERFELGDEVVLLLSARQWEFLVQHVGLTLRRPLPRPEPPSWPRRAARWLRRAPASAARWLLQRRARPAALEQLSATERAFVSHLARVLAAGGFAVAGQPRADPINVVMSDTRRRHPSALFRARHTRGQTLALFRNHPLVVRAVAAYARDPATLLIALPALLDGEDGWSGEAWAELAPFSS